MRIENFASNNSTELKLTYCGYEDCAHDFYCGPNIRTDWLIHLVLKGRGYYIVNERRHEVKEGEIFVIFPDEVVHYATYEDDPWSFCWIGFSGAHAPMHLELMKINRKNPVISIPEHQRLFDSISKLIKATTQNTPYNPLLISACLNKALSIIYESCINAHRDMPKKSSYVESAIRYIENNYFREISSTKVAKYLNIDRSYYSKIFRHETGITSKKFIVNTRLQQAIKLLKTTDYSAAYISDAVGFTSVHYFFRVFKREFGQTPTQLRNQKDC